jgi:hypothetical protein
LGQERIYSKVLREAADPAGPAVLAQFVSPNAGLCLVRQDGIFLERPLRFVPYEATSWSTFGEVAILKGQHALELRWRAKVAAPRGGSAGWTSLTCRIALPPDFTEAERVVAAVEAIAG